MKLSALKIAAAFLLCAPLSLLAKPVPINGFAAKVNGKVITQNELSEAMKFTKMAYERMPPSAEKTKMLNNLRADTLESLIERELILSEFEKRGGVVKPEMVDDDINSIIRSDFDSDRSKFLDELKRQGMTIAKFKEAQEKRIAVRYMSSAEIKEVPVATPTDIKKYYDANPDMFRAEGFIRLRTMTLSKTGENGDIDAQKKLVEEIHTKLKNGDDFATLAKAYSLDSASSAGGDRGTIGRDTQDLRPDLVAVAFAQKTGEVSQIIEDQAFYYIMKVESREPGKRAPLTDANVQDTIEKRLLSDQRKAAQDRWLERLKKTAIIKRY